MGYQLRIPGTQQLKDCIAQIARQVAGRFPSGAGDPRLLEAVGTALTQRLKVQLMTTDVCGAQVMCDEGIQPGPWNLNPDPELTRIDPNHPDHVKRFQLVEVAGLEAWRDTLEVSVHSALPPKFRAIQPDVLGGWIQEAIGPFLFESTLCGMTDLCHEATPEKNVLEA